MTETILHADVMIKECKAELYLNGIPLSLVQKGDRLNDSVPAHAYVVDGTNELSLVVAAGPNPSLAKGDPAQPEDERDKSKADMKAWARIARYKDGEVTEPGAGETLTQILWGGDAEEPVPRVLTSTVDLGPQFGPWQWQAAEPLTLDDPTRTEIAQIIDTVQQAYEKGDPGPIAALADIKHEELVRAYPIYAPDGIATMFDEHIKWVAQRPDWQPGKLTPSDYDLRLVADGRMVEAIAKDWLPIVRMQGDRYPLPMMLGRVGGAWKILR